jgi:hypothetical protein
MVVEVLRVEVQSKVVDACILEGRAHRGDTYYPIKKFYSQIQSPKTPLILPYFPVKYKICIDYIDDCNLAKSYLISPGIGVVIWSM